MFFPLTAPIATIVCTLLALLFWAAISLHHGVPAPTPTGLVYEHIKQIVEHAGGKYVGIQDCCGEMDDLVLFNSVVTGSTLAVPLGELSLSSIQARLARHHRYWFAVVSLLPPKA